MMKEKKTFQLVTSSGVCLIYELLHKKNLVSFPISEESKGKIDAMTNSITGSYFGRNIYPAIELKSVAYLYFIIKDHPFTDGNKRTASLVFEVVCNINNLQPNYSVFTLDKWAVFIEKIQERDHQKVIGELARILFSK